MTEDGAGDESAQGVASEGDAEDAGDEGDADAGSDSSEEDAGEEDGDEEDGCKKDDDCSGVDKDALMLKAADTITKLSKLANSRFGGDPDEELPKDGRVPGTDSTSPEGYKTPHGDAGVTHQAVVDEIKKSAVNGAVEAAQRAQENAQQVVAGAKHDVSADEAKQAKEDASEAEDEEVGGSDAAEASKEDAPEGASADEDGKEEVASFLQALADRARRAAGTLSASQDPAADGAAEPAADGAAEPAADGAAEPAAEAVPEAGEGAGEAEAGGEGDAAAAAGGGDSVEDILPKPEGEGASGEDGAEASAAASASGEGSAASAEAKAAHDRVGTMQEGRLIIEPAPGMTSGPISIRPPTASNVDLATHTAFASTHAYNEDLGSLQREIDVSEEKLRTMRQEEVTKTNFMEQM